MATVDDLVGKITGWVDKLFEFFGLYTSKYSKYLVYALMLFVVSKILKVNLKLDTGGKK